MIEGAHTSATVDRFGGVLVKHKDGAEAYLQPGDDATALITTLAAENISVENIDGLLCDYLEGQP